MTIETNEQEKPLKEGEFTHQYLSTLKNFAYKGEDGVFKAHRYDFYSPRGYEGGYHFHDKEPYCGQRDIYIDNFPGRKLTYRSDIPLRTIQDFHRECELLGIKIESELPTPTITHMTIGETKDRVAKENNFDSYDRFFHYCFGSNISLILKNEFYKMENKVIQLYASQFSADKKLNELREWMVNVNTEIELDLSKFAIKKIVEKIDSVQQSK